MWGAAEDGSYGTVGNMDTPDLATAVALALNREANPDWRDGSIALLPRIHDMLMINPPLSARTLDHLKEAAEQLNDALWFAGGALTSAAEELIQGQGQGQPLLEPDDIDPAPIDPDAELPSSEPQSNPSNRRRRVD